MAFSCNRVQVGWRMKDKFRPNPCQTEGSCGRRFWIRTMFALVAAWNLRTQYEEGTSKDCNAIYCLLQGTKKTNTAERWASRDSNSEAVKKTEVKWSVAGVKFRPMSRFMATEFNVSQYVLDGARISVARKRAYEYSDIREMKDENQSRTDFPNRFSGHHDARSGIILSLAQIVDA